jgi:glycosyltransferase involved in cell wall biosynthesis
MTARPPAVSVLMTAYNREPFIGAAIESVLAQRFGDFELLIVDDRSADRSVEIARTYERVDPRVRVVVNERTLGQFGNRNRAAALARGRLLKYHDSDDLMYPHCLEIMVALLDAEPRAGFGISAVRGWPGGPAPMLLSPRECYRREFLGFGLFMCGPASGLFRAEVFRDLGGFPEQGVPSDHLFWLRACARHHVLLMPGDLFWYRLHPGQELQRADAARQYAEVPGQVWRALADQACPLDPAERALARRNQVWTVARLTARDVRGGRLGLAWYRLRRAGPRPIDWIRYLRRPRRDGLAGTPLDDAGGIIVPPWLRGKPAPPRAAE